MKKLRLVAVLSLVVLASIVMAGCGKRTEVNFVVGLNVQGLSIHHSHLPLNLIVRSLDELDDFVEGSKYFGGFDEGRFMELSYVFNRYDAEYFIEKLLIICLVSYSDTGWETEVERVSKKGDKLYVECISSNDGGGFTVLTVGAIVLEIQKEDVNGMKKVRVSFR